MISNHAYHTILQLDLEPIKRKLMHSQSGEGWDLDRANAVETEYRRFLYLMKTYPDVPTAPLVDVDTFWHYHILDTLKYAADCDQAFGYFVHHYPYLGMDDTEDEQARDDASTHMHVLYEKEFGESFAQRAAALSGPSAAWCCKADPVVNADAAWCCKAEPVAEAQAQTAWCCKAEPVTVAQGPTAWCCKAEPVTVAQAQTAWCCKAEPVADAQAQTAWCCKAEPVAVAQAQTAWCCIVDPTKSHATAAPANHEAVAA